ncbi:unnamed protein product [Dibothriocephalus latus]|uniref:Rad50/SbcC-type AAA domain-containing protein n=1 Tax=Dibothriocephalus latus TaxID=60516 RepID=A0A3P7LUJ9_DIBLA|nr:unnamed protein product [Dibothriocephalus latus]
MGCAVRCHPYCKGEDLDLFGLSSGLGSRIDIDINMSVLEKMSIQGIRSFGPENPQRIEFFTPVTLILGTNGTGKTTIIECLKYAVTGELPPGAKTGVSFIHDPRLANLPEVKAKVALQVKDVRGCPLIVSRSLLATHREKVIIPCILSEVYHELRRLFAS